VEVARELHHVLAAGERARQAHRHVRGLGAGGREAHALGAGHEALHPFPPLDFLGMAGAVVRALAGLLAHGVAHRGRVVAEQQRAVPIQ
jgi:hypothetical protein